MTERDGIERGNNPDTPIAPDVTSSSNRDNAPLLPLRADATPTASRVTAGKRTDPEPNGMSDQVNGAVMVQRISDQPIGVIVVGTGLHGNRGRALVPSAERVRSTALVTVRDTAQEIE